MKLTQQQLLDSDLDFSSTFERWRRDLSTDVFEEDHTMVVEMTLPGVVPEEVEVSLDGDVLTVSGARQEESEASDKEYYHKEIRRGAFYRAVRLPKAVEVGRAEARYQDGMLTIELPVADAEVHPGVRIPVQEEV